MKKSCLIGLAGMLGIMGVANAASMQDMCEQNSSFVWDVVEKTCVERAICDSGAPYADAYCNRAFEMINVSFDEARSLVNEYRANQKGKETS